MLCFCISCLGTRISDTLTLRQNAVREGENGSFFIRIQQVKTGKSYEKAINTDVKALFEKACEYTNERYGIRDYVFVMISNRISRCSTVGFSITDGYDTEKTTYEMTRVNCSGSEHISGVIAMARD